MVYWTENYIRNFTKFNKHIKVLQLLNSFWRKQSNKNYFENKNDPIVISLQQLIDELKKNEIILKYRQLHNILKIFEKKNLILCFKNGKQRYFCKKETEYQKYLNLKNKKQEEKISSKCLLDFTIVTKSITWEEQYLHPNWQKMRLFILNRDNFTCTKCGDNQSTLHVHHEKYLSKRLIWEIPTKYLKTVCERCHSTSHNKEII